MNRTIKFRAKRIDNGEWCYGWLVGNFIHKDIYTIASCDDGLIYRVDPLTVGQFTGLLDKNGKEIFEGDIIRSSGNQKKWEISFESPEYFATYIGGLNKPDYYEKHQVSKLLNLWAKDLTFEIIGTIHDNPANK